MPIENVTPHQVLALPPRVRRIDVRDAAEFDGVLGHLPGAEPVPLATLAAAAGRWRKESPLLLICRSGRRSAAAARWLAEWGFSWLYRLTGGMLAVREAGLTVEGPCGPAFLSSAQLRDALCGVVGELYGTLTPPPLALLFSSAGASLARPRRQDVLHVLAHVRVRALADRLPHAAVESAVRKVRDLAALMPV